MAISQWCPTVVRVCGAISCIMLAADARADDVLSLAVPTSEVAHNTRATLAPSGNGALNQRARWLDPGGSVAFDIAVDGQGQNYATVRFWGGVVGHQGRIFLNDAAGVPIDFGQLDDASSSGVAPDRWYYATVPLPRSMTDGRTSVRLSLSARGNFAAYANPPVDNVQTVRSRGMYAVISHADPRLRVSDNVPQNPPVSPYSFGSYVPPTAQAKAAEHDRLVAFANSVATNVANRQMLDPAAVAYPEALLGGFDVRSTLDATHSFHIGRDNLGPLRGANVLAYAYNTPGTSFYKRADTLNRIALGIDYARRAQGSSGGYVDVWSPVQWVGGPNRSVGTGSLEGITHDDVANAFIQTYGDLQSAGLLHQSIDDDGDPLSPAITRRQAYADLFKGFVDFHTGLFDGTRTPQEYGHAPNQDVYQVRGLVTAYRALELLDPSIVDEATFAPMVMDRVEQAFGLRTSRFNNSVWFSPKGMPLEAGGLLAGGYSSEYGNGVAGEMFAVIEQLGDLATPQQTQTLKARALQAATIWKHFLYPVYNADGTIDLRLEGAINWRNSKINGLHQVLQDARRAAALDEGDPVAGRMLQLLQMSGKLTLDSIDSGHYWQESVWAMEQVAGTKRILNGLADDGTRLPHEAGQPDYAFVDEVAGAVSIKYNGSHIFAALNWHHGQAGGEPVANDIARVHEITPYDDRVATILMQNPHGFGELALLRYGDLLIAANASATNAYDVQIDATLQRVFDLVTQSYLPLDDGNYTLQPGQSAVFVIVPEPLSAAFFATTCLLLRRKR